MAIVYLITNLENGKRYVGKTRSTLDKRWYEHNKDAKRGSMYAIHSAIRKYGPASFNREVLGEYATEEEALAAEVLWIEEFETIGAHGYNMCAGGRGIVGYVHTSEARDRMRAIAIANGVTPSPEALRRSAEVRAANGLSDVVKAKMVVSQAKRRAENPTTPAFIATCIAAQQERFANERAIGIVRTASQETIDKRTPKLKEAWARRKANGCTSPEATDEFRAKMVVINGERARAKPIRTTCIDCIVTLSLENTMPSRTRRSGMNLRCRVCEAAKQAAWHAAHPGYDAARARRRRASA